ncbi:MAG TPA: CHAD domain-containing protein [Verrucomicrobiae bacterium]|nr:CHAD domain-containing protein [Verrucomicrobiae bacterium]
MPLPLRRIGRLSIDELCAAYDNEDVHTEHVTALALRLFDQTRGALDLPASGRHLLEAAGRLHDVGYSVDPIHHMLTSAEIVLQEGIKGFSRSERELVAQIMLRHSGKVSVTSAPKRVLQLAAFLRIADGLDYSHAQTTRIASIRRTRRAIQVVVRSAAFPYWLARANRKADLWRAVFPYDIEFVAAPAAKDGRDPLLRPDMPVIEAARRLLWIQFKTILANLDGAVAGETSEPVHDVRVAMRRMRTLLRVFRKQLPVVARQEIDDALAEISEELGPVRDLDEWVSLLESGPIRGAVKSSRLFPAYLQHHQQQRGLVHATVRRCLRGPHFASQRLKINRLLREELPRLTRTEPAGSLPKLAAKQFDKAMKRVARSAGLRRSRSPRKLHKLRITLRKARYLAEFFGPVLGPEAVKLARRLRDVERVLGRIHDIDLGMEHLTREGPLPPRAIAVYLAQERERNLAALEKEWRRFAAATGKR